MRFRKASWVVVAVAGMIGLAAPKMLAASDRTVVVEANTVTTGWLPWYEIKADPENSKNLIICGSKWNATQNGPSGEVYASSDGGKSWKMAVEDKNSTWVTEHSCAFGSNHRAYFISESAPVVDGEPAGTGMTRLFVSVDGGRHWDETMKTDWADYSTSVVGSPSNRLYTFFSPWITKSESKDFSRNPTLQRTIGLLIFSADGKHLTGPFLDSTMRASFYQSVFASDAVSLNSGTVVALYYGKSLTSSGWRADLGIVRASGASEPSLDSTVMAHPAMDWERGGGVFQCDTLADNSLAYDAQRNRLLLVYTDECTDKSRMLFTSSTDEGRTWTKSVVLAESKDARRRTYAPSLVVTPSGDVGLSWEEGEDRRSGHWLFSYVEDGKLVGQRTEVSHGLGRYEVSDDSLHTGFDRRAPDRSTQADRSIKVFVLSELNTVWRHIGLVATSEKLLAVWPFGDKDGTRLYAGEIRAPKGPNSEMAAPDDGRSTNSNITDQLMVRYDSQQFDAASGTLKLCLSLRNTSDGVIGTPLKIEPFEIVSAAGAEVTETNATNALRREGAFWDISNSVTNGRLSPGAVSGPFCLQFHLRLPAESVASLEAISLLSFRMKVWESKGPVASQATPSH